MSTDHAAPFVQRPAAAVRMRTLGPQDVPALHEFLETGIAGYRAFAPAAWEPPRRTLPTKIERSLADPLTYSRMAESEGRHRGPRPLVPANPPANIRLRCRFVAEPRWGTGLAQELHDGAVTAMGVRTPRLYTPTVHARAWRIYERRGWQRHGFLEVSPLGLPVTEYRRPQSPPTAHRECP